MVFFDCGGNIVITVLNSLVILALLVVRFSLVISWNTCELAVKLSVFPR